MKEYPTFDLPQSQRTDEYVYNETAKLLKDPYIIETFELELK